MTAERDGDNPRQDQRHVYGPRHIGALVPAVARPAFRKRAPAAAQLMADWPAIVGPALAAVTVPRRFASGTLSIACSGPIALELQHLAGELMARINAQLGRVTVTRLRFLQEPAALLAESRNPPPRRHRGRRREGGRTGPRRAGRRAPGRPGGARRRRLDGAVRTRAPDRSTRGPDRASKPDVEGDMGLHRRHVVVGLLGIAAAGPGIGSARAQSADPRMSQRAAGDPKAPVQVMEYFSLTCTHCAAFAHETYPQVKKNLIDTGKVFYIFRDFPLDQVALTAAMVARALPPERYEPFILSLFASQDRWAFARGVNSTEELAKLAALAGMPRALFDKTIGDDELKKAIIAEEDEGQNKYKIDSTPSFIVNGPKEKDGLHPGEMSYDAFAAIVTAAGGVARAGRLLPPPHRRVQELRRAGDGRDPARAHRHRRAERVRQVQRGRGAALGDGRELRPQHARRRDGRRDLRRHRGAALAQPRRGGADARRGGGRRRRRPSTTSPSCR